MSSKIPTFTLWFDLETTGVDEREDPIIEIGLALTHTTPAWPLIDTLRYVIASPPAPPHCGCASLVEHRVGLRPEVAAMHTVNGLLAEVAKSDLAIGEAEGLILGWIDSLTDGARVASAGSGVSHFDRRFLRAQMPRLDARLTHWNFDIGVLRRFAAVAGLRTSPPEGGKGHRALDDALLHVSEGRYYGAFLLPR